MKPVNVTQDSVAGMREENNVHVLPPKGKDDISIGNMVRISEVKSVFDKSDLLNWTEEIYTVADINHKYHPFSY